MKESPEDIFVNILLIHYAIIHLLIEFYIICIESFSTNIFIINFQCSSITSQFVKLLLK